MFEETLKAFQEQIEHSKQENVYLKKLLTEISYHPPDAKTNQADTCSPEQQNSIQAPLDSHTSVFQVKLELSTMQKDPEPQQQSCATVPCSPVHAAGAEVSKQHIMDANGSHVDRVPVKQQNSSQGPLNSTHVKLEKEKAEPQEQFNNSSLFTSSPVRTASRVKRPYPCSVKSPNIQEKNDDCLPEDSDVLNISESLNHQVFIKEEPVSPSCSEHVKSLQTVCSSFYCHMCKMYFENQMLLTKHMLLHQNKSSNCCQLCGKCYSTPHVLKIHLRTHTGERPYQCKFCDKTFSQKGHLKGHERMHTGEKIYCCSICGRCFTWMSQAKDHLRCHPGQLGRVLTKK
ncbi:zinc finger protein 26-like [Trichomycterus rosablanca]|uniref:zinc finger protein 26-like n=1 Tax=Trichomycterus rosablanca TaxID=2290929 RepID=UPI002F3605B5